MSRQIPAFVTKHACLERMWNFGMFVMERIDKASLKQVASSLTLTTLLSIVPALAVIMAAFSAFPLFRPFPRSFYNSGYFFGNGTGKRFFSLIISQQK